MLSTDRGRRFRDRVLWLAQPTGVSDSDRVTYRLVAQVARILAAVPPDRAERIVADLEAAHGHEAGLDRDASA